MAANSTCDQCGASDDHPKVVTTDRGTFHHDCLPFALKQEFKESSEVLAKVIEACEGGLKGDKLRDKITKLQEK